MYHFRFDGDDFWIHAIFSKREIKTAYKDAFSLVEPTIKSYIKEYQDYAYKLISESNVEIEEPDKEIIMEHIGDDELVIRVFETLIQRNIIQLAINRVLRYGWLDVEDNIISIIKSNHIQDEVNSGRIYNCFIILLNMADKHYSIIDKMNKHFRKSHYFTDDLID